MRLRDRVVFVTGGSRGIGRAIALACAREGADLVVAAKGNATDQTPPRGTVFDVARSIEALGRRALPMQFDITDAPAAEGSVASAVRHFGRIDVLVNNAGAFWMASVVETPVRKLDLVMSVNVRAAFVLSHAVLPHMIRQHYGHIVMMSPPLDLSGLSHHGAYALSKFGMTLLARAICDEESTHNVVAHALWPATPIESSSSIDLGVGGPETWRKPEIVADALVALVAREPSNIRGQAWVDETVLRREGMTDFSRYQCVPGVEPPRFPLPRAGLTPDLDAGPVDDP
jgi:citronellol/citronellal dehydrogenase